MIQLAARIIRKSVNSQKVSIVLPSTRPTEWQTLKYQADRVANAQGRGHWSGREDLEQEDPDSEERVD